jgi:hypothetical protein
MPLTRREHGLATFDHRGNAFLGVGGGRHACQSQRLVLELRLEACRAGSRNSRLVSA